MAFKERLPLYSALLGTLSDEKLVGTGPWLILALLGLLGITFVLMQARALQV